MLRWMADVNSVMVTIIWFTADNSVITGPSHMPQPSIFPVNTCHKTPHYHLSKNFDSDECNIGLQKSEEYDDRL